MQKEKRWREREGGLGLPEVGSGSIVIDLLQEGTPHRSEREMVEREREREKWQREREGALGSPEAEGGLVVAKKAHYTD